MSKEQKKYENIPYERYWVEATDDGKFIDVNILKKVRYPVSYYRKVIGTIDEKNKKNNSSENFGPEVQSEHNEIAPSI